jgi:hypothetical protein
MQHCVHLSGLEGRIEPEIGDKPRHAVAWIIHETWLFSDRGVAGGTATDSDDAD